MESSSYEKAPEPIDRKLLSGTITPEAFLEELLARDQSTGDRIACIENIKILTLPAVRDFFAALPEELPEYENFLSFSYFHRGQIEAVQQEDIAAATASFDEALVWARRAEAHDPEYRSWRAYVEGTCSYFSRDTDTLRTVIGQIDEDDRRNREILEHFMEDLEGGGQLDYLAAYKR